MSESNEEVYTIPDYMRMHPSMCYGKLGDGTEYFDCIYLMLQAIIDNSIDEFKMGFGDRIEVAIDYATGESYAMGETEPTQQNKDTANEYVLNKSSKKIHLPDCKSVKDISEGNKEIVHKPKSELIDMGYVGCKSCNP
jgi:hypothetical protein